MTCSEQTMVVPLLLLVLVFISSGDACSCLAITWSTGRLCCKDFVLHGDVVGNQLVGNFSETEYPKRMYTVKVKEIFRGIERIKNVSSDHNTSYVELYTSPEGASCGITLQLQESYVITGSFSDENRMVSYLCGDWNTKWQDVSQSFKASFPKLKSCKCDAVNTCASRFLVLLAIFLTAYEISWHILE